MRIDHAGQTMTLSYSEDSRAFGLWSEDGELYDRLDHTGLVPGRPAPNLTWVSEEYISLLTGLGVVEKTGLTDESADGTIGYEARIVHPDFNDGGYSPFGDFSRSRLGQQCQYGSRYILGLNEGYPALGEGLRFLGLDRSDYHSIRIHRDDMDEFERRYRAHCDARLARV